MPLGTSWCFMGAESSLARMLAENDRKSEVMDESESASQRFICGSPPVRGLSPLPVAAFELIARGKKVLQHAFIQIRVSCKTVLDDLPHIHFGIQVAN